MESILAKQVAEEVLETIGKGKNPIVSKIALKKGYSPATSKNPQQIKKAQSYKDVIEPFVARLERHREKVIKAMEDKDLSGEEYKVLSDALTKITHDVQLLSGGKTENIGLEEDRRKLKAAIALIST